MNEEFKDKIILVTGGTGSIGSELVRQLLKLEPKQIRVLSRNETRQYNLLESLGYPHNLRMLIGDIRDRERLQLAFRNVDIVFHAAALKHVPFCEYNPSEAMKTNIMGSHNVVDAALHNGVKTVVAISTDKAANPLNTLGTSKLMMEKIFINSNYILSDKIKFACVRFGNVAWSDGSVLQMWKNQAETKGVINVTSKKATRFFMSINQAVSLILNAATLSQGGEIFVLKMPSIKLDDLSKIFIKKYFPGKGIKIKEVDNRTGDNPHEVLVGSSDWSKAVWSNKDMLILLPGTNIYNSNKPPQLYRGFKKLSTLPSFSSKDCLNPKAVERVI